MNDSQRAWELAMVFIANGRIPFDPANPSGSVKILSRHLQALEAALHDQAISAGTAPTHITGHEYTRHEHLGKSHRKPSLVCAD
ncbi:hypothetical protein [Pseudomonas khavaziana]|uniref:hypothetical protein n=1 Tax=Pseudomonas khavaziana TaxID=2842351 RepID=UPI001C3E2E57|nr:hypothetical protein [Pseudomonas khavaziana]MBV4481625.1 hypothetical protein [Pseudomonas khavaziana]